MTFPELDDDRRFDALLRDLGPDVPHPQMDASDRARLERRLASTRAPAHGNGVFARMLLLAACLALSAVLGAWALATTARLDATHAELEAARWDADETLELLTRARAAQPIIAPPDGALDLSPEGVVVITFDHELCPIARVTTPAFERLATEFADRAQFVKLDVTGDRREAAEARVDELHLRSALLTPLGGETGVVKIVDTANGRVICAGPGRVGLEQASSVLVRLATGR